MAEHAHGHEHSAEEMKKHVMRYVYVGAALLMFTGITVAVSRLHVPRAGAIYVGLMIASLKAFLVAGYFMHLFDEKKIIYRTLVLTVILFIPLLFFPWFTIWNANGREEPALQQPAPAKVESSHEHH